MEENKNLLNFDSFNFRFSILQSKTIDFQVRQIIAKKTVVSKEEFIDNFEVLSKFYNELLLSNPELNDDEIRLLINANR